MNEASSSTSVQDEAELAVLTQRILLPSPIGVLGIEFTGDAVTHLVIVPKGAERKTFKPFADLKRNERTEFLEDAVGRISEFMAGARRNLGLRWSLDLFEVSPLAEKVLMETAEIPYGETMTYQEIASAVGEQDGYRQILSILMLNPLPLLIPCHRIVTTKSGPGSFIAGAKKKEWLLKLESRGLQLL